MSFSFFVFCGILLGGDAKNNDAEAAIRRILEAWEAKRTDVKTLEAWAKVDSFYPKGYFSDELFPKGIRIGVAPEKDTTFVGEPVSWAVDFDNKKVKKEEKLTVPMFYKQGEFEFTLDQGLHLYSNGKYRLFRPKNREVTPLAQRSGTSDPDVVLYESASHQFLLSIVDCPILWLGGGVNGKWPDPNELRFLEDAKAFSFRGETTLKGQRCVVLSLREQQMKAGTRQFWVSLEKTCPILMCRAQDGDHVYWQVEIDYKQYRQRLVPANWKSTGFDSKGKITKSRQYWLEEIRINEAFFSGFFDKELENGQIVFDVVENRSFVVSEKGSLLVWILGGMIAIVTICGFARHFWKKKKRGQKLS